MRRNQRDIHPETIRQQPSIPPYNCPRHGDHYRPTSRPAHGRAARRRMAAYQPSSSVVSLIPLLVVIFDAFAASSPLLLLLLLPLLSLICCCYSNPAAFGPALHRNRAVTQFLLYAPVVPEKATSGATFLQALPLLTPSLSFSYTPNGKRTDPAKKKVNRAPCTGYPTLLPSSHHSPRTTYPEAKRQTKPPLPPSTLSSTTLPARNMIPILPG